MFWFEIRSMVYCISNGYEKASSSRTHLANVNTYEVECFEYLNGKQN